MTFRTYCCRHLWPIIRCGTYDGDVMDPDYLYGVEDAPDDYWENSREFVAVGECNTQKFMKAMAKEILEIFQTEKPLEKFGVKVVGADIDSPREYNFRTDWAELTIEVPDDFVEKTVKWIEESATRTKIAKKWLDEHWMSYDCWRSCMPESWDEMHDWIDGGSESRMETLAGGLLGMLTAIDSPELYGDQNDYDERETLTYMLEDAMRERYSLDDFYPIYKPNELLRKYGLEEDLRIDEKEDDFRKVHEKIDGLVEWRLDELAYADQYEDDEAKERARKDLFDALREKNIRKLSESNNNQNN